MEFVWVQELGVWVGRYEVTNGEYRARLPSHSSLGYEGHDLDGSRQPVVQITWKDACAFAAWLTDMEQRTGRLQDGSRYRLPTESEFMAYAQCGDAREFPWGGTWPPERPGAGNYADLSARTSFHGMHGIDGYTDGYPVSCDVEDSGTNAWGLAGVGGNVWECCAADAGEEQAFGAWRGGSWCNATESLLVCSSRIDHYSTTPNSVGGFRLVLEPRAVSASAPSASAAD